MERYSKQNIIEAAEIGEISMIDAVYLTSILEQNFQTPEYILCAAIWYKELPTQVHLPKNITKGLVVCGHRHGHCIDTVKTLAGLRTVKISPDGVGETEQGFLTNTNRFVDREEAFLIAQKAEQLNNRERGSSKTLFSEDLY